MRPLNNIKKMENFLEWFEFKIQSVHKISNQQFINILEKM